MKKHLLHAGTMCALLLLSTMQLLAAPSITFNTQPSNQTACAGNNASFHVVVNTIYGSNTLTGITYAWNVSTNSGASWTAISGGTNSTLTLNAVTVSMSSYQYHCVVKGSAGSPMQGTSSTVSLTVNASPTVTANASANPVCSGSNVTLTGGGAVSYVWNNSITNGVAFTLLATTTYNVTGTDANSCTASNSITVTIDLPTVQANASSNPVCVGSTVALTGSGATSYAWSNSVADGVAFTSLTTTTYNVTGTDGNGCTAMDSITVTVDSLPTPLISLNGSAPACQGKTVTLKALSYAVGNAISINGSSQYLFTPNLTSDFPSSSFTIELWFKPTGAGIVLDELGINNLSSGWHDSQIEVESNGTIKGRVWFLSSFTIGTATMNAWNHIALRYNDTTQLVDGYLNGVHSVTTTTGVRLSPQANGWQQYWVIGPGDITNSGNGSAFNGQVREMRIWNAAIANSQITTYWDTTVAINSPNLIAYYKMDEGSGKELYDVSCHGNNATLYNNPTWINYSQSFENYATFNWSQGGAADSSLITQSGTYTVSVTNSSGCSGTASICINLHAPQVQVLVGVNPICGGSSEILTASGDAATFVWDNSVTNSTGFNAPITNTTYHVTATDDLGCQATDSAMVTVVNTPPNSFSSTVGGIAANVTFSGGCASSYLIRYSTDSTNWNNPLIYSSNGFSQINGLLPNTTYYTQAKGITGTDTTGWSGTYSFTTQNNLTGLWAQTGAPGFSNTLPDYFNMDIDTSHGIPYAMYADDYNSDHVIVDQFVNGSWQTLPDNNLYSSYYGMQPLPAVMNLDGNANPYVLSYDMNYNSGYSVMHFDGSNWNYVGSPYFANIWPDYVAMAVDKNNTPYIAYDDEYSGLSVMKFDGSNWDYVGSNLLTGGTGYYISLIIDNNNNPVVSFQDNNTGSSSVSVMQFDGSNWNFVGQEGITGNSAIYTSLAMDRDTLYLAFLDGGSNTISVVKYNGSNWANVGNGTNASGNYVNLAISKQHKMYVGYADYSSNNRASVIKFDGNNWVPLGPADFSPSNSNFNSLAVDNHGMIYMGFQDYANNDYVSVMQYQDDTTTSSLAITSQPSNDTLCSGSSNAIFTVGATGTGLTYQWQGNGSGSFINLSDNSVYSGTANDTLIIDSVISRLNGYGYRCIVSGGGTSDTSNAGTLTVNITATFTQQAQAVSTCMGNIVKFSIATEGGIGVSYQWESLNINTSNVSSLSDGSTYSGTNTDTLSVVANAASAGLYYRCVATNSCSDPQSSWALLTAGYPTIFNLIDTAICGGNTITLTAGNDSTIATWDNGITDGVVFTPTQTTTYHVVATNNGCTSTDSVTVSIDTVHVIAVLSATSVCRGSSVYFQARGTATIYNWDNGISNNNGYQIDSTITYHLTGTDGNGCSATDSVTVIALSLPTVIGNATANPVCAGSSVTLYGSGSPVVSYTWTGGVTNDSAFFPTSDNTYNVTGIDSNGCQSQGYVVLNYRTLPSVIATASDSIICSGTSVTLGITGSPLASVSWDNGVQNGVPFVLSSTTTYHVVGNDGYGCLGMDSITVTVNPKPTVTVTGSPGKHICYGVPLTLTASGGVTYAWSDGITNGVPFTPSSAGNPNYFVTVTGANGCKTVFGQEIQVFTLPVITVTPSNTSVCAGQQATLTASGGQFYTWKGIGGGNSITVTPDSTTVYTVKVTDNNECTANGTATITVNPLPTITTSASATIVCSGTNVTLTGSGAQSYTWNNNVTDGVSFIDTTTTTFTVTGTDGNGCTATDSITVSVNPSPIVHANASATNLCAGQHITLSGSGNSISGYTWDNGVFDGEDLFPLSTTYHVTGTASDDCSATDSVTIIVKDTPTVTATTSANYFCAGGTVTLTSGGNAQSYTWNNNITDGVAFADTGSQTFTVTGTGTNGCTTSASVAVVVNKKLPLEGPGDITASTTGASCSAIVNYAAAIYGSNILINGGAEEGYTGWTIDESGGYGWDDVPYATGPHSGNGVFSTSYGWDVMEQTIDLMNNGYSTAYLNTSPAISVGEWYTASSCCSATDNYFFTAEVRDSNNNVIASFNYGSENNPIECTQGWQQISHAFIGYPAGARYVRIVHGGKDNEYWAGWYGTSMDDATVRVALPDTITYDINPGSAFNIGTTAVHANATNTCGTDTVTFNVTVQGTPASITANGSTTFCQGSSVGLDAGAGYASYLWSTGDTIETITADTTATYSVTVTGVGGCTSTASQSVNVNPNPTVQANTTLNNFCVGADITLWGSGTALYYNWDNGVQDNNSFVPQTTTTYHVIGTDGNWCSAMDSITINVNQLPNVTANASSDNVCLGGKEILTGGGALNYKWNEGIKNGVEFYPVESMVYDVTGTDSNGCVNNASIQINVNKLPVVTGTASESIICQGSSVTLTGNGAVSYKWSSNVTNGVSFNPLITSIYRVIGTDINGCSGAANTTVTVLALPSVDIDASASEICIGEKVILTATGAQTYLWNNGVVNGVSFTPDSTETYSVIGTSSNGCSKSTSVTVKVNSLPVVTANTSANSICAGGNVILSGNGASYYKWNNNVTNKTSFIPLITKTYTVTGTDANGCSASDTISVTVNNNPTSPVATAADNISSSHATANWNTSAGANSYYLDIATDNLFGNILSGYNNFNAENATSFTASNLQSNTTYYYRVRAASNCGSGTNSNIISFITASIDCSTLTGGAVSPDSSVICSMVTQELTLSGESEGTLQWQGSTDNKSWVSINGANDSIFIAAPDSTKKYYRCLVTPATCPVMASTTAVVDISVKPVITITNLSSNSVSVSWTPFAPGQYNISWSGVNSGSDTAIKSLPYIVTDVIPNSDVNITVTPIRPACNGANAATVQTHTLCATPTITSLNAVNGTHNPFKVEWSAVSGATSYRIYYRQLGLSTTWSYVDTTGTQKTIMTASNGGTFAVYVAANNCPSPGIIGEGSSTQYVTINPSSSCTAIPTVTAVSTCPNQLSVNITGGSGTYSLTLREVSPVVSTGATYTISRSSANITVGTQHAGSVWEIYATSVCSGQKSPASNVAIVSIKPACPAVANVVISNTTCNGFSVSWNPNDCSGLGISSYQLLIKDKGALNYTGYTISKENNYAIVDWLQPDTSYDVAVRTIACNNVTSALSIPVIATLPGCSRGETTEGASVNNTGSTQESVVIYPNPAQYQFSVDIGRKDMTAATVKIELFNELGQVMQTNIATITGGHLNQIINLGENMATGLYFVRISVGENVYVNRLVISRD